MNKAQLIGHVGKDPEIRTLQGGGKVATFSVATSEAWKDKQSGERRERTEWHRIVVFNAGLVTLTEKYIRKGAKLYVEGQLATRRWETDKGQEKQATEIVLRGFGDRIELLDRKPQGAAQVNDAATYDAYEETEEIVF